MHGTNSCGRGKSLLHMGELGSGLQLEGRNKRRANKNIVMGKEKKVKLKDDPSGPGQHR